MSVCLHACIQICKYALSSIKVTLRTPDPTDLDIRVTVLACCNVASLVNWSGSSSRLVLA